MTPCREFHGPTWADGSPVDQEWRAAAYERAATRPCTDLPTWTLGGRRAKHCRASTSGGSGWGRVDASCGGTP